jgi:uncharacterized membrane protein
MTMKTSKALLSIAVTSLLGTALMSTAALADDGKEQCAGVAKAGKNDCAGAAHACAGQSKGTDGSGKEWVKLPKGTCDRLVGGSLTPK